MSAPLQPLADGLWSFHHRDHSTGGLRIGTRSNVIRLADGTLALHAPGPLDEAQLATVRALGSVSTVIFPNLLHTGFATRAAAAFPEARILAAPGVATLVPGLRVHEELGHSVPKVLADVAEMLVWEGCPAVQERVFFLPATRTLLGVDLNFNLHGLTGLTRFAMWLNNANDRYCVTRLARAQYIKDSSAAGRSVRTMADAWDIDSIVVSHGDIVASGGRSVLREAWAFAG